MYMYICNRLAKDGYSLWNSISIYKVVVIPLQLCHYHVGSQNSYTYRYLCMQAA